MSVQAGETYVAIRPDVSGFRREAQVQIDRALARVDANVRLRPSTVSVRSQFDPLLADVRRLRGEADQLAQRARGDLTPSLEKAGAGGARSFSRLAFRATAAGVAVGLATDQVVDLSNRLVDLEQRADASGKGLTGVAGAAASLNREVRSRLDRDLDGISKLLGFDRQRVRLMKQIADESERAAKAVDEALAANRAAFGEPGLRGPGAVAESNFNQPLPRTLNPRRPVGPSVRLSIEETIAAATEPLADDLEAAQERLKRVSERLSRSRLTGNKLGKLQLEQAQAQADVNRVEQQIADQQAQATQAAREAGQRQRQAARERLRVQIDNHEARLRVNVQRAELDERGLADDRRALQKLLRFQQEQSANQKLTQGERLRFADAALDTRRQVAALKPDPEDRAALAEARLRNREARAALTKRTTDDRLAIEASIRFYRSVVEHSRGLSREQARAEVIAAKSRLAGLNPREPDTTGTGTTALDILTLSNEIFQRFASDLLPATGLTASLQQVSPRPPAPPPSPEELGELKEQSLRLRRIEGLLERGAANPVTVVNPLPRPTDSGFIEARLAQSMVLARFNG